MVNRLLNLRELSLEEFKEVHYEHLVNDFPLAERKPFFTMAKMFKENTYACYALTENDEVKAYATLVWKNDDICLLDYFATVSSERGTGLGSIMLSMLKEELNIKTLIFECENPEYAKDEEDKIIREKRIAFYKKNGAYLSNSEVNLLGVNFNIMYMPMKLHDSNVNVRDEMDLIYKNMYPKVVFRNIAKVF